MAASIRKKTTPSSFQWARRCREYGGLQPLPSQLALLRFERWPANGDAELFSPIAQLPLR